MEIFLYKVISIVYSIASIDVNDPIKEDFEENNENGLKRDFK